MTTKFSSHLVIRARCDITSIFSLSPRSHSVSSTGSCSWGYHARLNNGKLPSRRVIVSTRNSVQWSSWHLALPCLLISALSILRLLALHVMLHVYTFVLCCWKSAMIQRPKAKRMRPKERTTQPPQRQRTNFNQHNARKRWTPRQVLPALILRQEHHDEEGHRAHTPGSWTPPCTYVNVASKWWHASLWQSWEEEEEKEGSLRAGISGLLR